MYVTKRAVEGRGESFESLHVVLFSLAFNLVLLGFKLSFVKKLKGLFGERKQLRADLELLKGVKAVDEPTADSSEGESHYHHQLMCVPPQR